MDFVPHSFVDDVVDLLFVSPAPIHVISQLQSLVWSRSAKSTSRLRFTLHLELEAYSQTELFYVLLDSRGKTWKIDDLEDLKNASCMNVYLCERSIYSSPTYVISEKEYAYTEATLDDAFVDSLRRLLAGRNCGTLFFFPMNPERAWVTDRLIRALPTTFREIDVHYSSESVEKFILETGKLQDINSLAICDTTWTGNAELRDVLVHVLFSNTLSRVCVFNVQPRLTFDFPIFEEILERWVHHPDQFLNNEVCISVAVSFEPSRFDRWCTRCRSRPGYEYCRIDDGRYTSISCIISEDEGQAVILHFMKKEVSHFGRYTASCKEAGCF